MRRGVILDTGPLVAFLDQREKSHVWVSEQFQQCALPFLTCESVLTEACFLLQRHTRALDQISKWVREGMLQVTFSLFENTDRVFDLMRRYRNLPMSLADACLVVMVEIGMGRQVFTLDEHFRIYRHSGRRVVPVITPD